MANTVKNSVVDPFDSDSIESAAYVVVQSTGYSGSFDSITIPSANYPDTAPDRVFVELPHVIDQSDLAGSRPMAIKTGVTGTLTRTAGVPADGFYRIPNDPNSIRGHVIEVNSAQIGETLDYDYYGKGSAWNANEMNDIDVDSVNADDVTAVNGVGPDIKTTYRNTTPVNADIIINTLKADIGDWDMNTSAQVLLNGTALGLTNTQIDNIIDVRVWIRNDANTGKHFLNINVPISGGVAGDFYIDKTVSPHRVVLNRETGGFFDAGNWSTTSYNRGWIYITYED